MSGPPRVKYTIAATAKNVEQKQRVVRGYIVDRGLATQHAEFDYETLGWWLTIGDVSFYLGENEPDISSGNRVKVTIERLPESDGSAHG